MQQGKEVAGNICRLVCLLPNSCVIYFIFKLITFQHLLLIEASSSNVWEVDQEAGMIARGVGVRVASWTACMHVTDHPIAAIVIQVKKSFSAEMQAQHAWMLAFLGRS